MAELTVKDQLERARSALSRVRAGMNSRAKKLQNLGSGVIASYAMGAWEASRAHAGPGGTAAAMPTLFSLNHLLVWGLGAYLGGEYVGGEAGEVIENAGFGLLCAYAHKAGTTGTT